MKKRKKEWGTSLLKGQRFSGIFIGRLKYVLKHLNKMCQIHWISTSKHENKKINNVWKTSHKGALQMYITYTT